MNKFFRSKKFVGISSFVLAASLVVGNIAIRKSQKGNGLTLGSPVVYADGNLLDYDSSSLINYSTILGRAIDYGIVSDSIEQKGHMETTFATNKFINPNAANNCDVDLAGPGTAQFIIASVENGSKARFGRTYGGNHMDFVIDTTYTMAANEDDYFVYDEVCKAYPPLYRTYDYDVLKQNVDSMIKKGKKQSDLFAAKDAFDGDTIAQKRGDSGATIDLSDPSFQNATIYINVEGGSNLEKAIKNADGLLIIKHPSTNVVFNMLGGGELELTQYRMQIVGEDFSIDPANGQERSDHSFDSTTTNSGEDSVHNSHVEKYMTKSIIWNIRNAASVKYNATAGLFLVPNNIPGTVTGSSAGWIVSAGKTTVSSGEFHYICHDREDAANTEDTSVLHFAARKGFVSTYARNAQGEIEELTNVILSAGEYKFTFEETEADYSTPKNGGVAKTTISVDANSKITFPNITVDVKNVDPNVPLKRYFVVKEDQTVTPSDSNVELSKGEIDIELNITNIDGIIHYTVNTKKYFSEKTSQYQPADDGDTNIQASGAEFSLGAFLNKYNKKDAKLTLKKAISGDSPDSSKRYSIAVKKGSQYVQADGSLKTEAYYFQVPADGTGITIDGLNPGEYTIIENEGNIAGYNLISTTMSGSVSVNGTTTGPNDITSDGKITLPELSEGEVTVTNTYDHVDVTDKASLTIGKSVKVDGTVRTGTNIPDEIASKEFEFVISTIVGYDTMYVIDANGTLGRNESEKYVFKAKPGETVTVYGLDPNKSYTVKEQMAGSFVQLNGFDLTSISIDGNEQNNIYNAAANVQTDGANSNKSIEVVNSYTTARKNLAIVKEFRDSNSTIQPDQLDHLDQIKIIVSGPDGYSKEITGRELRENNWRYTIPNVPAGSYTITERDGDKTSKGEFVFSDYTVSGNSPTRDNDGQLIVTNTYTRVQQGQLTIQKNVQANGVSAPSSFEVYIQNEEGKYYNPNTGKFDPPAPTNGPGAHDNPTVTVPANGSYQTGLIPEGKYTITEKTDSARVTGASLVVSYKVGTEVGNNVVDLHNYGATCEITNTYTKYNIEVTKLEAGDHMYDNWTYEFWIKDLNHTEDYYVLPSGESVRLASGQQPYYFSIKAGDTKSVSVPVMLAGQYQVIEKNENVAANTAYNLVTTYSPNGGVVSLDDQNASGNVTITNTYEYVNHGSLKITKHLTGTGADTNKVFDIDVAFSTPVKFAVDGTMIATATDSYTAHLKAGETVVLSKIPAGVTYTVTETISAADAADGYSNTDITGDTDLAITKGAVNEVEVNNAYATQTGSLTVHKTAKDNNNHTINYYYEFSVKNSEGKFLQDDKQTFDTQEVFFTIGTGEEVVFNDLPVGEYIITENTTGMFVYGYTFEESLSTTSGPATVAKNANTDFTLNNVFTQDIGSLSVKKTATDNNGNNVEGTFKFTISTPMRGYLQDDGTFGNQKHYFTIKAGESMTFDDLPADNYMVVEDTDSVAVTGYTFNMADSEYSVLGKVTKNGNANVELVNKYTQDLGTLRVTKTATDNNNTSVSGTFEFSVKNSKDKYLQADKQTFDDGEVFFTVEAGSYTIFDDIPTGEYTVTEKTDSISVAGYTFTTTGSTTSTSATVTKGGTVDAELINNFNEVLGSLTVGKVVNGAPATAAGKDYEFTVTGPNGFSDTFTLKAGETKTLSDLHLGTYTVTENETDAEISGYTLVVSGEGDVELTTASVDGSATVQNDYTEILGTLTVKKEVTGAPSSEANKTFEFTVTGPDNFSDTFTLQAGETMTLADLHLGKYTITETGDAGIEGYLLVTTGSGAEVTLTPTNKDGSATVKNEYTEILGSLTVKKEVTGAPSTASTKDYNFTVTGPNGFSDTFTLKAGETKTLTDLHLGTYTVTEDETDAQITGYDLVVSGNGTSKVLTTVNKDETLIVTNDYTEILGSLTVKKEVTGAPSSEANKTFEFTVTGPNGFSDTFTLKDGETKTLSDLHLGTYTVTENGTDAEISGYTLVVSGEGDVELTTAGVDGYAIVTNDYTEILGSLTVEKVVNGAPGSEANKTFEFTVTGPNGFSDTFILKDGETKTLSDLHLGTYTVTENGTDAQITGYDLVVSGTGDVELTTASVDGYATVQNNYTEILGSLTVEKVVNGAPGSEANKTFEFTVTGPDNFSDTFTLKDGETKTLSDLKLGTYTVTENGADAEISGYTLVVSGEGDVELTTASVDGYATVQNDYTEILGTLTVKKEVTGAPSSEANKTFEFTVTGPDNFSDTFTLQAGETMTLADLHLGKYTITETGDAGIEGYLLVTTGSGAEVTLTSTNKDGSATVKNEYTEILGSLTVKKEVTGAPSNEANKTFKFTVDGPNNYSETFELQAGETKTLTDLHLGTYTVTEDETDAQITGYDLVVSGNGTSKVLTTVNKDETLIVKNAYSDVKGSLTVKKEVTGAPSNEANKTFKFTVDGPNNYSETFELKAGETKTLTDLTLGTYTVTEDETDAKISGYNLVVSGVGDVTLTASAKDGSATVKNTYSDVKGSLTIGKTVTGAPSNEANKIFEFTVSGPEGYSATFKLKDGESKTLSDLKLGQYTITENRTDAQITGYDLVVSGENPVTLTASAKDGSATVKNAYTEILGSLTVGKTVSGAPGSEANKLFEFIVSGPEGYSATFKLKDGETKTLSDLKLGQYTVREIGDAGIEGYLLVTAGSGATATLTGTEKDKTLTVTNTYTEIKGSLTVKKEVTGAPSSASGNEYEFTVTGPEGYSATFKLKAGETKTLSDLKLGTYTVTENEADAKITGFDLVVSENGSSKTLTTSNKNDSVTVKNTYSDVKGSLVIGKTVTGAPSNEVNKIFEFTVEGPNNYSETVYLKDGETKTLTDLTLGQYTITENRTDAQITGYDLVVSGENPVTLTASAKDGSVTVKNAYTEIKGSLTVKKEVTGAPSSASGNEYEFTVTGPEGYSATFKLKDGETKTLSDLKLGTYTVTENEADAQITGFDLVVSGTGDVTLTTSAKDGSATVKNAYSDVKGSLTIGKTVTGAPSNEANKVFEFTVEGPNNYNETVYLKDGETKLLTDLTLGQYTITENRTDAQITGYDLVVSGENPVTLTASAKDGSATVKNAYTEIKGSLTVKKEVTGAPSSASTKEYEFTVTNPDGYSATFTLKAGETKTLSDLALNTYTVTENETDAQIKGYTLAVTGTGDVTLTASAKDGSATVKNAYTDSNEKTSVSVQKVWNDNNNQNGDRPTSLTVTLSNGQSVVLNDGNSWTQTVSGLPKYENGSEIVYTWTEEQVQGYTMSSITTDASDPTKTVITNDYDASSVQTSATIKKVWDDNNDAAGVRPASLVVYLFKNGTQIDTCTLNEANGWTATVNNLEKYDTSNNPYSYTWTEETVTVAGYAEDGTTVSDTTTTITNKYTAPAPVLGSLKIKKVLASGAPTDASSKTYHFTVTGTKGYTTTVDIQGAGEAVLDNLEQDTYTITEDTSSADIDGYTLSVSNNGATVVINSAAQQECEITNTYTKDVQPTSTQPSDTTPTDTQPTGTQPSDTTPTGTQPTSTQPTGSQPTGTKPTAASPDDDERAPSENTPTPDAKPSGATTTPTPDKEIESVTIDDKPVTPEDYKKKPDGTVEFSSRTIEGLTLGVHRAVIKYKDGTTVTVEFEVITSARTGRNVVKTGDVAKNNLVPAVTLFTVAAAAVAIVIFRRRRSERDAE